MTYANVVATLALVFAMGGSAVAASHYLITSSKQISPKVLKELKAPGKPGPAGPAGAAGATGASGATGAAGANGSNGGSGAKGDTGEKGEPGNAGGPAAHWKKTIEKPGESKTSPATVVLEKVGPFTLSGRCYLEGSNTVAETYIGLSSGEEGFASESNEDTGEALKGPEEKPVTSEHAVGETSEHEAEFIGPDEGLFSAETKSGSVALDGAANEGVYLEGKAKPACYFSGYVIGG